MIQRALLSAITKYNNTNVKTASLKPAVLVTIILTENGVMNS